MVCGFREQEAGGEVGVRVVREGELVVGGAEDAEAEDEACWDD